MRSKERLVWVDAIRAGNRGRVQYNRAAVVSSITEEDSAIDTSTTRPYKYKYSARYRTTGARHTSSKDSYILRQPASFART